MLDSINASIIPLHHSLFFDVPFDKHGDEIYTAPQWPTDPLFYVSVPSVTDRHVAPEGGENLVFLIPVASGLKDDTETLREKYFKMIVDRMEKHTGESITGSIVYKKSYAVSDFVSDYNSFRGNAYGLANTLRQTSLLQAFLPEQESKESFLYRAIDGTGTGSTTKPDQW